MFEPNDQPGKLAKPAEPVFENDLGESPIAFAHFTQDQGTIAVGALAVGFVLTAMAGIPVAVIVGLIAANDLMYCNRRIKQEPRADDTTENAWAQANRAAAGEYEPAEQSVRRFQPTANTQLQAIEASVAPTVLQGNAQLQQPQRSLVDFARQTVNEVFNNAPDPVRYLIGDRLRCALIVAVSGGGKDLLLSNAVRAFLPQYPDFSVVVMDCKADSKETGYYAQLPRTTVYRMDIATAAESTAQAWIDAVLDDFNGRGDKVLLVVNEGTDVRALSKRYADVVSSFVSSGDSRQKYVWEAGHSGHTVDLRTTGPGRSRFRPLAIALLGEEMQIESILQAKWFADSAKDMRVIESEMRRSPVKRAWSDGRRWYPMPRLENYSGYDRDSRSFINGQQPTVIQAEEKPIEVAPTQLQKTESDEPKNQTSNANDSDGDDIYDRILSYFEKEPDKVFTPRQIRDKMSVPQRKRLSEDTQEFKVKLLELLEDMREFGYLEKSGDGYRFIPNSN